MCRNVYVYTQGGEPKNALPDAAMKARRHPDLKSLAPCERRSEQDYRCHIKAHNHSKNELTKSALLPQKQQEHKKQQQHKNTRGENTKKTTQTDDKSEIASKRDNFHISGRSAGHGPGLQAAHPVKRLSLQFGHLQKRSPNELIASP